MSRSGKVSRTFEFLHVFGAPEKSQGAATEKEEQNRNLIPTIRTACLSLHLHFVS